MESLLTVGQQKNSSEASQIFKHLLLIVKNFKLNTMRILMSFLHYQYIWCVTNTDSVMCHPAVVHISYKKLTIKSSNSINFFNTIYDVALVEHQISTQMYVFSIYLFLKDTEHIGIVDYGKCMRIMSKTIVKKYLFC